MALEAGQKMDKEPPVDLTFAASGLHPSDSAGGLLELHNKHSHVTDFQSIISISKNHMRVDLVYL